MRKIQSLFCRNYETDRKIRDEIVPGSEWAANGEGTPTRKYDGTCCMIRDGKLWKRYEVKKGKKPPAGFEPATEPDPNTGKQQGWVAVGDDNADRWHREALEKGEDHRGLPLHDGTYELCGPKVQGNPEKFDEHVLVPHGCEILIDVPTTFDGIREYLETHDIEGIVWHHRDGRMVKIKGKDYGIRRGSVSA
ncbi:DUF5565 family protein [Crateriforma conspicua]|uniref:Uncharacterized protein n=2 Tax=Crateriforma conspicua TaxID=2527996 RepID=A0A5C6FHQ0_9PLAN|nr:hypothetical protein V7x_55720 [Crateriforma conspicua]